MVVKKSDGPTVAPRNGPTVAPRTGRSAGHQKARSDPALPHHTAWLGWVILGALVIVAVALAIAAASLGGG
jgi:hypothetical protein